MKTKQKCLVTGCAKTGVTRGYCSAHYHRLMRYGNPLGGKTANGEPRQFFDEVVLKYEGEECLVWPFARTGRGYGVLFSRGKNLSVHRLVCENVHGPAPSSEYEAAHSCGKGHLGCVAKRHLSWKTAQGNQADRVDHGTHLRGEKNVLVKLSEEEVRTIRLMRDKMTQHDLARQFGVAQSLISKIQLHQNWSWLD